MSDPTPPPGPEASTGVAPASMTPKDWADRLVQTCMTIGRDKPTLHAARETLFPIAVDSQQYAVPYTEARQEVMAFLRRAYPEETARERAQFGLTESEGGHSTAVGPSESLRESPRIVTASELLSMPAPLPEPLIGPYSVDELLFAYAFRGVGKTLFALGFASATAAGGAFLGWKAPKPRKVLYVDGELPIRTLHDRLRLAFATVEDAQVNPSENLLLLSAGVNRWNPNLAEPKGLEFIEQNLEDVDLLVLDSLSTLCRGGEENNAESWQPIQDWLVSLRARNKAVLALHHAGKSGQQRGTSKREDIFEWVLGLKHPTDYQQSQGARFEVHFEKARPFHGPDAVTPIEAWLETGGRPTWTVKSLANVIEERILKLHADGMSARDIGKEVGRHHSNVLRFVKKAKKEGRLPDPEDPR